MEKALVGEMGTCAEGLLRHETCVKENGLEWKEMKRILNNDVGMV